MERKRLLEALCGGWNTKPPSAKIKSLNIPRFDSQIQARKNEPAPQAPTALLPTSTNGKRNSSAEIQLEALAEQPTRILRLEISQGPAAKENITQSLSADRAALLDTFENVETPQQ